MISGDLYLYASVAGTSVALRASQVEAVVRLGEIVPVQCVPSYVRGLAALRSRVLTIIDMQARVTGVASDISSPPLAVVVEAGGHTYGLIVASVSDIATAPDGETTLQGKTDEMWEAYASRIVIHGGRSHLVLAVEDFVAANGGAALAA